MRILSVTLDNSYGGIQNRILKVGSGLKNYGVETVILTPNITGDFSVRAKEQGFKVYQVSIESPKHFNSIRGIRKNFIWLLEFPFACLRIIKIIKREKIDIVHLNGLLSLQAMIAAKIVRKPIAWHLISTIYPPFIVRMIRPFYTNLREGFPILITYKTRAYYFGKNYPKKEPPIIHEPVDSRYFDREKLSQIEMEQSRNLLMIRDNEKIVGVIGNINPQKGLECFIQTVKEISAQRAHGIRFLIIGGFSDGTKAYYLSLRRLVTDLGLENLVNFVDRVPDTRPIYQLIDVFLLTSIAEGTPMTILEAMSMQKAIVAVDVGGISEQIENGVSGFVNKDRNPVSLAEIVIRLLDNPDLRKKLGRNARERAEKCFSYDECISNHLKLYGELMGVSTLAKS